MGGSFSFPPGRPGRPRVSGGGGGAPRPPAGGEVTRRQTQPRTRPGQLGKLQLQSVWGRSAPRRRRRRQPSPRSASGATCRRSAAPRPPETPLSSRPGTEQPQHWNAESIYLSMRPRLAPTSKYPARSLGPPGCGRVQDGVPEPLSRAAEPRDQRWHAPEPAAANSCQRWTGDGEPDTPPDPGDTKGGARCRGPTDGRKAG